jgi:DNA-binding NarL/FixJ family response regulator
MSGASLTDPRRVLVVDDHPVFRRGLRVLLEGQDWVGEVVEASTVAEALREVVTRAVDVVVLDLALPDGNGVEATSRILRVNPSAAVLILTMTNDDALLARAMHAGARGYLTKETAPDTVIDALRAVASGAVVLGPQIDPTKLIDTRHEPEELPAPLNLLSLREREILAHLASGQTNAQIADDLRLSEKTIRNQLSVVFAKLGVADRVQAALIGQAAKLAPRRDVVRP